MLFFFSSRRRHTRSLRDWSSDVCSSDLHSQWLVGATDHWEWHTPRRTIWRCVNPEKGRVPFGESGFLRSEERRVGKECRSRGGLYDDELKIDSNTVVKAVDMKQHALTTT